MQLRQILATFTKYKRTLIGYNESQSAWLKYSTTVCFFTTSSRVASLHTSFDSFVVEDRHDEQQQLLKSIQDKRAHQWKMNGRSYPFSARKMRKNFAGVIVVVLAGILICFALANIVMVADQTAGASQGRSHDSVSSVNFRSLKNNRRSIEQNADGVFNSAPQWQLNRNR